MFQQKESKKTQQQQQQQQQQQKTGVVEQIKKLFKLIYIKSASEIYINFSSISKFQ